LLLERREHDQSTGGHVDQNEKHTVLLSTVHSDSHMWNLVFLQLFLEENGNEVVNLGPCTPPDLVVSKAREVRPDLIVISTVNSHGHIDGLELVHALRSEPDLAGTRIVIGGKLGIEGEGNFRHGLALHNAGFDAVFEASTEDDPGSRLLALLGGGSPELAEGSAR
jgi:methylaspartate mutase sigma subunit